MREVQEKEIRIKDLDQHLSILKKELSDTNESLTTAKKEQVNLKIELANLEEKRTKLSEDITGLVGLSGFLRNSYSKLTSDIESLKKDRQVYNDALERIIMTVETSNNEKGDRVRENKELIQSIVNLREVAAKDLQSLEDKISENKSNLDTLKIEYQELQKELEDLETQSKVLDETLGRETADTLNTLRVAEESVESEKKKIELPKRSIQIREEVLAKKEKNLGILIRRFMKIYNERFPGLNLNI